MSGIQFAEPQYAHLLWILLLALSALFWLERRGGKLLGRFMAPEMQRRLVERPTPLRRGLQLGLLALSLFLIVIALMRPQWGFEFIEAPQVGAEIMIAVDVSRSMLAEDVVPNRLERSKAEIRDLLAYLDGDQVGLIAFAGRASVVCPLTPDFGFLRLVLDNLNINSVTRGGTRLEEPIRKATAGFGTSGDLARVILLFTDGEDHDSFPLDAAREAAERGIRVLVIGFGDEAGSEIVVTDPKSGARTRITDEDGQPVISRLDGELLREIALLTEGAYVPAGTGVLDLESIFETHIRPLMRGLGEKRGRTIQKDAFQWALLAGLIALLASVISQAGRSRRGASLLLALCLIGVQDAGAQTSAPATPPPAAASLPEDSEMAALEAAERSARERLEVPEDPRRAYNRGLQLMREGELEDSQRLLEAARQGAGNDGELRFRSTYNLGWVEVEKADSKLADDPETALASLEISADWFREAIALRPADTEPRRNLEIILERVLALADSLAKKDSQTLETRLDALIEQQRAASGTIRNLVESTEPITSAGPDETTRTLFKNIAVQERLVLGQANSLARIAGDELEIFRDLGEENLSPEDAMRSAQLEALLHYTHRAQERIGQARSQLRRRQGTRAHRRAAAALSHLKRAREQLMDPVKILDGIIGDAGRVMTETRTLLILSGAANAAGPSLDPVAQTPPVWLNPEYLAEAQDEVAQRSAELAAKFLAGIEHAAGVEDPQQLEWLEKVRAAEPDLSKAAQLLEEGIQALRTERLMEAAEKQAEALTALIRAREEFLDLKGLIEVAYGDEKKIVDLLQENEAIPAEALTEFGPLLAELQQRNLERVERMTSMIEELRIRTTELAESGEDPAAEGESALELKRLELADGIVALTESAMSSAVDALLQIAEGESSIDRPRRSTASALRGLENLQRLFFSMIEHLRDVTRQQIEVADETEEAAGREEEQQRPALGPIGGHQGELATRTDELATALHEQSLADPAEFLGEEAAADPAAAEAITEKLIRVSELVLEASGHMESASGRLAAAAESGEPEETPPEAEKTAPDFDEIREFQDFAVQKLLEALELLEPQQEEEEPQEQQGDSEQEQPQPQESETGEGDEERVQDPGQLLQAIRDKEAERHRRDRDRDSTGYEPVDKDW